MLRNHAPGPLPLGHRVGVVTCEVLKTRAPAPADYTAHPSAVVELLICGSRIMEELCYSMLAEDGSIPPTSSSRIGDSLFSCPEANESEDGREVHRMREILEM